jgi:hypothetical protein
MMNTMQEEAQQFEVLKRSLQTFQSDRLNATYARLKERPEYGPIANFFFNKLYGPQDNSFRDASMRKLHAFMDGKAPKAMVTAVDKVIELHELCDSIDEKMVHKMMENGIGPDFDMDDYRRIYRDLDNYDQRIYQINLSIETAYTFYQLSKKWVVRLSLKTVCTTANCLGVGEIMDFVYEGYLAFRVIKNIDFFLETINTQERAWHDHIWNGRPLKEWEFEN